MIAAPDPLRVHAVTGREAISETCTFDIAVTSDPNNNKETPRALFLGTGAVLAGPQVSAESRAAAELVRAQLIPALSELQDRYLDEAQRAKKREPLLSDPDIKAALKRIPYVDKETMFDVAKRYVAAGIRLHDLLSDRGDVVKPDRRAAITVRPRIIGVLNDLRAKLRKEIAKDASLPRDLEARVFGYHDTVLSMKKPSTKPAKAPSPPEPPK